jgi:hypothetical protein
MVATHPLSNPEVISTRSGEGGAMKTGRWVGTTAALLCGSIFWTGSAEAQVDQAELAQQIAQSESPGRFGLAVRVREMGPENADPALREVLVTVFSEEAAKYSAYWRGEAARPDLDAIGMLAMVVGEFRDPRAIPSFMSAIGLGPAIARGLAAFGEPAVPHLVEAARSGERSAIVIDALIALRFVAEGVGHIPLTPSSRQELIAVARTRLEPRQSSFSFLTRATDLAYVLGDPELMQIVEAMAVDPPEVASRLENPSELAVERVQERAKARLSGEPPLPSWDR